MKKQRLRKVKRICTAACFAVLFSSCAFIQRPVSESGFALYYLNEDLDQLETQGYMPSSSDTEALIEEVIAQQNRAPEGSRLASLLPAETVIRSYDLEGTTLTLDFSGSYYGMQTGREMLVRGGLVREFLQIVGVERLVFTVEEEPAARTSGQNQRVLFEKLWRRNRARYRLLEIGERLKSYRAVVG